MDRQDDDSRGGRGWRSGGDRDGDRDGRGYREFNRGGRGGGDRGSGGYRSGDRGDRGDRGGFGGDRGGGGGGQRSDDVVMDVESRSVGRIIGKGGQTIKRIQGDSGARIKICNDEANGDLVPVRLIGTDEAKSCAKDMIEQLLLQQQNDDRDRGSGGGGYGRSGGDRGGDRGGRGGGDQRADDVVIDVASRSVGRIVGKGGQTIRQIESDSGARIKICKDESNGQTTPVRLIGSDDAKAKAKEMVEDLLAEEER